MSEETEPSSNIEDLEMFTTEEVAELFKVSTETVARWIRGGRLLANRFGYKGHYRISTSELRRFVAENHGPPTDADS